MLDVQGRCCVKSSVTGLHSITNQASSVAKREDRTLRCSTRPSLTQVENFFCGSQAIFWLILLPKARETSIGPIRKTLSLDPAISNFKSAVGRQKIEMCKSLQMGVRKLENYETIPNLVPEFELDNI